MKQKAILYAKAALVVAVIFVGFPLITYVIFGGTQRVWDVANKVGASVSTAARGAGGSVLAPKTVTSFLGVGPSGAAREAKRVERDVRRTISNIAIFAVILTILAVASAAGLQSSFAKDKKRRGKERKHHRRVRKSSS